MKEIKIKFIYVEFYCPRVENHLLDFSLLLQIFLRTFFQHAKYMYKIL